MIEVLNTLRDVAGEIETVLTDAVAKVAPWCAPIPTAYLVGRATVEHLAWPVWVGIVAAVIVESLGLATTATALELREYNASKRKSDPPAPFVLAAVLVGIYLVVAVGLTVALDTLPVLAVYSPAIFPILSLCGVTVLAIRGDHRRRVETIEDEKAERKAKRTSKRMSKRTSTNVVQVNTSNVQGNGHETVQNGALDAVNTCRRERKALVLDAMMDIYRDSPEMGATEVARQLDIGRSTVYNYMADLEKQGRIRKNGEGIEVIV